MTVYILDTSDFDGPFDVATMKAAGISALTNKATEGTRVKHATYGPRLTAARAAGMTMYGAYIVPRTPGNGGNGTIQQQVDYYLAYLDQQTPWWRADRRFIHQVDLELWGYDSVSAATGLAVAQLLRATGHWTVIYASYGQYGSQLWGKGYPLWNAAYGANTKTGYVRAYQSLGGDSSTNWHGDQYALWQFGSQISVGTPPHVGDCSAFRGTDADLERLIGLTQQHPQEVDMDADQNRLLVNDEHLNSAEGAGQDNIEVSWSADPASPLHKVVLRNRFNLLREQLGGDLDAKLAKLAPQTAPTQEQVDAAVLKAFQTPGVIDYDKLGAAVASHFKVA